MVVLLQRKITQQKNIDVETKHKKQAKQQNIMHQMKKEKTFQKEG